MKASSNRFLATKPYNTFPSNTHTWTEVLQSFISFIYSFTHLAIYFSHCIILDSLAHFYHFIHLNHTQHSPYHQVLDLPPDVVDNPKSTHSYDFIYQTIHFTHPPIPCKLFGSTSWCCRQSNQSPRFSLHSNFYLIWKYVPISFWKKSHAFTLQCIMTFLYIYLTLNTIHYMHFTHSHKWFGTY